MKKQKIDSFTKLIVWQKAHGLVLKVYEATDKFSKKEQYILTSQMLRCAISISSNIAEGFTRTGKNEKRQFYYFSKASLTELQNQLIIAKDREYIDNSTFKKLTNLTIEVSKLLNKFIKGISKLS